MTWPSGSRRSGDWWDAGPRAGRDGASRHRTSRGEPIDTLREESLPYRDLHGRRQTMTARVAEDDPMTDPFYRTRLVVDTDTLEEYVQKRVHNGGRLTPTAAASRSFDGIDAVDNEIQIGLHMIDAFGERTYPRELSKLFGYYADDVTPEPFVFVAERGRPVERFAGRLLLDQAEQFPLSLLRALELLEAAGVVHRCLNTATIRFDDRHVQLADFRNAVLAGERCGPAPEPNWAAPETLHGASAASAKEDIYSAGQVLAHVAASGTSGRGGRRRDDTAPGSAGLLGTMTDYDAGARPSAADVLAALGGHRDGSAPPSRRATTLSAPRYVEGQRRFDAIIRRRAAPDDTTTVAPAGAGGNPGRR